MITRVLTALAIPMLFALVFLLMVGEAGLREALIVYGLAIAFVGAFALVVYLLALVES